MPRNRLSINKIVWNAIQTSEDLTEILIYDEIADKQSYDWWTDERGTEVTPRLFREELNKVTTSQICIRINSGGGDVFAAEAIRTAIMEKRQEGKQITCKIDGFCGSAAVGIAAACESIAISASSYLMVHDPAVFAFGYLNIQDFEKGLEMLQKVKQGIVNAYAKKTGKDKEEISEHMTKETWFTGDEAVENGYCDELMFEGMEDGGSAQNVVNSAAFDISMYRNIPKSLLNRYKAQAKGGFANTSKTQKESAKSMPDITTVDQLKREYPDLVNQIEKDAKAAERKRIQDIEDVMIPGFEDVANEAKFEKPVEASEVAMKIIAEQKKQGTNYLNNRDKDVKNSGIDGVKAEGHEGGEGKAGSNPFDAAIDKLFPASK